MLKCSTNCGKAQKGPYRDGEDCLPCWVFINSQRYRSKIDGGNSVIEENPPIRSPACELLQVNTVYDRRGQSCVHKWIVGCDRFRKCTTGEKVEGIENCRTCTFYIDPTKPDEPNEMAATASYFNRVVLINLKRRNDRIEAFRLRQASHGWELPEPTIFRAIEGNAVGVPAWYQAGGGAYGCMRSHQSVIEQAIMDDIETLLVLEDDVTWRAVDDESAWGRFRKFMEDVPADWEVLMLGGQHQRHPISVKPGVAKCTDCQRTHAYAIRRSAMKDLLRLWHSCNTHIDHRMGPWLSTRKAYAPDPFLFGQSAGQSDISGKRNPDKFWIPPSTNQIVVYLKTTKEIVEQLRGRGFHIGYDLDSETGYDKGLRSAAIQMGAVRSALIRKWLDAVLWEAASLENAIPTLWHPGIAVNELREIHFGEIVEIEGDSVDSCLSQLPKTVRQSENYAATHVVHLVAERDVAESLQRLGFHIGGWRCQSSGHDHGLKNMAALPQKVVPLRKWIEVVANEAATMENGVATVWHPSISVTDLERAAEGRRVISLRGDSVQEIVRQFREAVSA